MRIACRNNSGNLLVVFTVGGFELYVGARIGILAKRSRLKMDQNEPGVLRNVMDIQSGDYPSSPSSKYIIT